MADAYGSKAWKLFGRRQICRRLRRPRLKADLLGDDHAHVAKWCCADLALSTVQRPTPRKHKIHRAYRREA